MIGRRLRLKAVATLTALLLAAGALAPLLPPLVHPPGCAFDDQRLVALTALLSPAGTPLVPVNDPALPLLRWAIPLWDARGQVGMLFTSQRRADGAAVQLPNWNLIDPVVSDLFGVQISR